jgi:perosamine synthetase
MKYLDDVVSIAVKNYGYAGDCPVAEQLSKKVLIIPSYYSLKQKDVQHIARCMNAGWAEISKAR